VTQLPLESVIHRLVELVVMHLSLTCIAGKARGDHIVVRASCQYNKDEQTIATKPSIRRSDLRRVYCSGWLNRVVRS
jgi:hypothetical protein